MTHDELDNLADAIVSCLFRACGENGAHLRVYTDIGEGKGRYLGGWSHQGAFNRIRDVIGEQMNRMREEAPL